MGGDFSHDLDTKSTDDVIRNGHLELDHLLGEGKYTVSEFGDVMPIGYVDLQTQEEVERIEFKLRGAYNLLKQQKENK